MICLTYHNISCYSHPNTDNRLGSKDGTDGKPWFVSPSTFVMGAKVETGAFSFSSSEENLPKKKKPQGNEVRPSFGGWAANLAARKLEGGAAAA